MRLTDYLLAMTDLWCAATGRQRGGLASQVANDGKFFQRLEAGTEPRTGTFEKFLAFFRDGANWPDHRIPLAAADLLDALQNIAVEQRLATGMGDEVSRTDNAQDVAA